MPRFIFTGCYTSDAIKGMLAKPSDREAAARGIVEAAGGKLIDFYGTTGPKDFLMIVDIDDAKHIAERLVVSAL